MVNHHRSESTLAPTITMSVLHHDTTSMNDGLTAPRVGVLARRIHGWTWQAFPIGMGTGAVYVVLAGLENHPSWLTTIETMFYFLNMTLFLLNVTTLLLQFILYRVQFIRLLCDPVRGIFVPLVVLSFATIIIGTINYAVPPGHIHPDFIYVLFWIYVGFALLVCFPMLMIWFNKPHDLNTFTPAWAFLVFPMMLVGVVAFNVLNVMEYSDSRTIGVLLTGYVFQGLGFFVTFFYLVVYMIRIMTTGFLNGHQANGAFVACGPPGFTALALLKLGMHAREILPRFSLVSPLAGEIFYASSVLSALLLFGLAIFFFVFGALPYWFKVHKSLSEILGCWAITFPNVGWISTLRVLGDVFDIHGFNVLHAILAVAMCCAWLILFVLTVLAFWKGKIFLADENDVIRDWAVKDGEGSRSADVMEMQSRGRVTYVSVMDLERGEMRAADGHHSLHRDSVQAELPDSSELVFAESRMMQVPNPREPLKLRSSVPQREDNGTIRDSGASMPKSEALTTAGTVE